MNRTPFESGEVYHLFNRGTEKRNVFMDTSDRIRFLDNLREFNDKNPALNWKDKDSPEVSPRERIVEVLAYCLMPNHYHLMLRQIYENGITLFMRKLGTGYTMYFNKKYERSGGLFQGACKSVLVDRDEYIRYLPHYIHLNPAGLHGIDWRKYKWSSYKTYSGQEEDPILDIAFVKSLYDPFGYAPALDEWAGDKTEMEKIKNILLD